MPSIYTSNLFNLGYLGARTQLMLHFCILSLLFVLFMLFNLVTTNTPVATWCNVATSGSPLNHARNEQKVQEFVPTVVIHRRCTRKVIETNGCISSAYLSLGERGKTPPSMVAWGGWSCHDKFVQYTTIPSHTPPCKRNPICINHEPSHEKTTRCHETTSPNFVYFLPTTLSPLLPKHLETSLTVLPDRQKTKARPISRHNDPTGGTTAARYAPSQQVAYFDQSYPPIVPSHDEYLDCALRCRHRSCVASTCYVKIWQMIKT